MQNKNKNINIVIKSDVMINIKTFLFNFLLNSNLKLNFVESLSDTTQLTWSVLKQSV
jgi:hypothetical protein